MGKKVGKITIYQITTYNGKLLLKKKKFGITTRYQVLMTSDRPLYSL